MAKELDLRRIEEQYRDSWQEAFEANPDGREKIYLNVAFPYPSGAMHVGHGRTYTVPDVIARFYRMQGKNVLFPMGFHVTGTPVIGISRRIARGDEKTLWLYRDLYRVPPEMLEQFAEPRAIVRYFSEEYQRIMSRLALSIDWRRRFITVDPQYSKFIEWQYKHLHERGCVVRGAHPVKYCPQCESPVGDHDLLEGDKAEIVKFTLVMFHWKGALIPTATLRPETIYGVTNLWVNPNVTYVRARIDGQTWIVSPQASDKLRLQDHDVTILEEISGRELVEETVMHPLSGEIPILPADFVDPDMASGLVMSVPAHAPFDYIALRDLQQEGRYTELRPIPLVQVEGYGEVPARDAVERAGIKNQRDTRLDRVTQEVYSAEFSRGKMLAKYGGLPVREARDAVIEQMLDLYCSVFMYDFDLSPVICRCGGRAYVKILHDQWFLQYSNPEWKQSVHDRLNTMKLVPPEVKAEFDRTVDWLKDWACTRRIGLGTRLPWDPEWIVEPLSDSTMYMAYYTMAHRMKSLDPTLLTPEVFDYIFFGTGRPDTLDAALLDEIRDEFLYWYPYDFRFSAKDLISNHLTFQLFHHQAIFPKTLQPRGMVVFGMGLLNGAKMSSSKGNVVLLEDAITEFGADTVRMFLVGSAEPWQDFDWRNELVASVRKQIERFWNNVQEGMAAEAGGQHAPIDAWFLSRLQSRIERTTQALAAFQTRQALQEAYFGIESDLKWYRRRTAAEGGRGMVMPELFRIWVRLLAPFIPYTCEQLWKDMGEEGSVAFADWPVPDPQRIDRRIELEEELLSRTVEDIESIVKLIQLQPRVIHLYVAPAWKWDIFRTIARCSDRSQGLREIMKDASIRARGKEATATAKQITALIHRLPPSIVEQLVEQRMNEKELFESVRDFLEREFSVPVRVLTVDSGEHAKAENALPYKPAIVIE